MGWFITLKSDKEITVEEIEEYLKTIPDDLKFQMPFVQKSDYGWLMATQIQKPVGNTITIRGSYGISGDKAIPMRDWLKGQLKANGHKVSATKFK